MISNQLDASEYHPYYKAYIDKATGTVIVEGLKSNLQTVSDFLSEIPKRKHNYAYAEGKWTIKEVLLHIIDTERIFAYRALRIARGDQTPLAGFEQNDYVIKSNASNRSFESLVQEYESVRKATISLFDSFDRTSQQRVGEASGAPISVRALGYIITGHENHHIEVIKTRYL
ncbi:DinB family protein [Winogradskyella tangerina]|uniref:DinB family protein n=1 Tax=Winogradskyella tangerina TaxID=2023240 RepID=UPI000DBE36D4|nr:DinB family protein [Winogradskyella tangerina]